ncbi:MAG: extracellular solute-binding protein [Oscillospiraceae bacterium]|nr:extracellular solute-binding protein [Oscillospiraceae bacterium]
MKRMKLKNIISLALCFTLMLGLLAACNENADTPENTDPNSPSNTVGGINNPYDYEPPQYIYVAKTVSFPIDIDVVHNLSYFEEKVFFTARFEELDEKTQNVIYTNRIFSMNLDGTDFKELSDYVLFQPEPIDGLFGNSSLTYMQVDSFGNIWVAEEWHYNNTQLPSGSTLRKLDSGGNELVSIDLGSYGVTAWQRRSSSFGIDSMGNIYFSSEDDMGSLLYVLSSNGDVEFKLSLEDTNITQFIPTQNGSMAIIAYMFIDNGYVCALQRVDFDKKAIGDAFEIPENRLNMYPGSGDFDLLFEDNSQNNLYGFDAKNNETVKLLSWLESDVLGRQIGNITMLPDERIICTNWQTKRVTKAYEKAVSELLILTKVPYSEAEHKTILTLATLHLENVKEQVISFNKTNPDYRIHIKDYWEDKNEDFSTAILRLNTDIIAGKVPDILDVSNPHIPYKQYAKKGLFENLYPYIDSDPVFNRNDFIESVLSAAETNGSLYQLFPSFYVNTFVGHPSVVGTQIGWTMDEFATVLNAHPKADYPLGQGGDKMWFLWSAVSFGIDDYVDMSAGTAHFDADKFSQLLKLAATFPDEYDYNANEYMSWERFVATGRAIMSFFWIGNIVDIQYQKALFGGEIAYKGFPSGAQSGASVSSSGAVLTITTTSAHKEGAWQFIRTHLDGDWQLGNTWGIPINKAAFETYIERSKDEALRNVQMYAEGRDMTTAMEKQMKPITDADIDQLRALVNSVSTVSDWNIDEQLWNLISEGASDYFRGAKTLDDTVRIIQSRASIYVAEQSG